MLLADVSTPTVPRSLLHLQKGIFTNYAVCSISAQDKRPSQLVQRAALNSSEEAASARDETFVRDWINTLFENKDLLRMGHHQRAEDANLGLGWLYYALARILRPARVVVIGSFRGFVPLIFSKALADNSEGGQVWFIDPSLVDDFWKDPSAVRKFFGDFGASNIEHFLMTTQQFVMSEKYRSIGEVGIVFVDGYHSEEQARFDYEAFKDRLSAEGIVLFHDSVRVRHFADVRDGPTLRASREVFR